MKNLFRAFLVMLARGGDRELARQVQFLKVENKLLRRRLPKRIKVTAVERRRLLKFGKKLGSAIYQLVTIVSPRTFFRWMAAESPTANPPLPARTGRPRTGANLRELIVRIARETGWGYSRILGELNKLGLGKVCRSTVVNILREEGFDPNPQRGRGSWADFVRRHAETLWACDFFQKKIWTARGCIDYFLVFFMHIGSRRVHLAGMTTHPDGAWVTQQARNMAMIFQEEGLTPRYLLRDRDSNYDSNYTATFDEVMQAEGIQVVKVGPRAPNMNAHIERFLLSLQSECLDHFIVFGEDHLRHLTNEYLAWYHAERPHQSLDNLPLSGRASAAPETWRLDDIACEEKLGGVLKSYHWKIAA